MSPSSQTTDEEILDTVPIERRQDPIRVEQTVRFVSHRTSRQRDPR